MAGYWTRFAKTGNPNRKWRERARPSLLTGWTRYPQTAKFRDDDEGIVRWPAFKHPSGRGSDRHLVLDLEVRQSKRLRERQCDFLEPFFFRSILAGVPASAP
jgi:hypothetical protein